MYRSSRLRSTLNTGYITGLGMCKVYVPKQSIPQHLEHGLHYRFGHVSSMTQKCEKRSTFFSQVKLVSHLWQRQKHCSQWDECSVWVLGHACCRNHMKRCLKCTYTSVYYGEYMIKNARDQGPGRNNQGPVFHCSYGLSASFQMSPAKAQDPLVLIDRHSTQSIRT